MKPRNVLVDLTPAQHKLLARAARDAGRTVTAHARFMVVGALPEEKSKERKAWDEFFAICFACYGDTTRASLKADEMLAARKARWSSEATK